MFVWNQGLFSFSGSASEKAGGAQQAGRGHSQDTWHNLAKGIFYTCAVLPKIWTERRWLEGLFTAERQWALVSVWWAIALCVTCLSWALFHSLFAIFILTTVTIIVTIFLSNFPLWNCRVWEFRSFSILLPIPLEAGRTEWAAAWCLGADWWC